MHRWLYDVRFVAAVGLAVLVCMMLALTVPGLWDGCKALWRRRQRRRVRARWLGPQTLRRFR